MDSIFRDGMSAALISGIKEVLDSDLIGVDDKDVEIILSLGNATVYSTQAVGIDRATAATQQAVANFLKKNNLLSNVQGILISIAANQSLRMREVYEALNLLNNTVPEDTTIVVGAVIRNEMNEALRLTIIATGAKIMTSIN
ncbi:hypothetical protein [Nitrosomonas oligotropha]|uniref:hypothetical protein n=1 Tax=Nitrosomonas oligotropha TaxID=42354 RepID=UPI00136FD422|nr:hypothetical protein [Nitrosomonas oligotropha]MXS83782.1 hypothetical protein [Nitrosomonas oligotropha]